MKKRITKNRYVLFILVFFISLGFAYLSANLNILGGALLKSSSWDIHFEDIEVVDALDGNPTPTISTDKKSVDYVANFNEPGDVFSFNVDVVNAGTIDGMIDEIINDGLTTEQQKLLDIEYKYANGDPFEEHFVILKNSRKTINVKLQFKYDINEEDLPTELTTINLSFSITYKQASEDAYSSSTFKTAAELVTYFYDIPEDTGGNVSTFSKHISPSYLSSVKKIVDAGPVVPTKMVRFLHCTSLPDEMDLSDPPENVKVVSTEDSDIPIFMWESIDDPDNSTSVSIYWYSDADIVFFNKDSSNFFSFKSTVYDFYDYSGIENISTSKVEDFSNFFNFHSGDIDVIDSSYFEGWDTSNVKNFDYLFFKCNLDENDFLSLSNWDVSSCVSFEGMFSSCNISNIDFLSDWNISNTNNISSMFSGCSSLSDISALSNWNVRNVETFSRLFSMCTSLNDLSSISDWDVRNVVYMSYMLSGTSITNVNDLSNWKVNNLKNISDLFSGCSLLNNISALANWNVDNVTDFSGLFFGCSSLSNFFPIKNWNTENATNISGMFMRCTSLVDCTFMDGWNFDKVDSYYQLFSYCSFVDFNGLNNLTFNNVKFDDIFSGCTKLIQISGFNNCTFSNFNSQNIYKLNRLFTNLNLSVISGMNNVTFKNVDGLSLFKDKSNLSTITGLNNCKFIDSSVDSLFYNCSSLTSLSFARNWDVSGVTSFYRMFYNCSSLTSLSGLENWDITSSIYFNSMFYVCTSLTDVSGVSSWAMRQSAVSHKRSLDLRYMFQNCSSLSNATALSVWFGPDKIYDYTDMFKGTTLTSETKPNWYNGTI